MRHDNGRKCEKKKLQYEVHELWKNLTGCTTTTGSQKCRHSNVPTRKLLTTLSLGLNKEAVIISELVVGQGSLRVPGGFSAGS